LDFLGALGVSVANLSAMSLGRSPTISAMRCIPFFILICLFGCEMQPMLPEDDALTGFPKVVNIRPDFPADKAVLHVQAETTFLKLDADLTEAWSLVSTDGIDPQQLHLLAKNGIRAGTMDAAAVSQFYTKLPRTGGTKTQTIGVGREPVIFETTPTTERSFEMQALLGLDRDELLRLPAGRTQLLLDVVIDGTKVTMGVTPHHHWMEPSLRPKSPHEKAMEGRMFKEISFDVTMTGDRFLVLGLMRDPTPLEQKQPQVQGAPVTQNAEQPPAPVPTPAPAQVPSPAQPMRPAHLKFGELLFTGQRADKPLQLLCIIRVPPQGELFGDQLARPER